MHVSHCRCCFGNLGLSDITCAAHAFTTRPGSPSAPGNAIRMPSHGQRQWGCKACGVTPQGVTQLHVREKKQEPSKNRAQNYLERSLPQNNCKECKYFSLKKRTDTSHQQLTNTSPGPIILGDGCSEIQRLMEK